MAKVNDDYPKKDQISDEQLKAMATAQYHSGGEQSTSKFPTEIIELPSKGLLYAEDNPLSSGKIEMKYMTAKEEDILTTQSYIKQGVVLDKLFKALIVSNGEGRPVKYDDILVGDKNAVMIAARVLGYGKEYQIEIDTPSGTKQKENIDLTELKDKEFDESLITPGINSFEFELPISKKKIKFKLLSHKETTAVDSELKRIQKAVRRDNAPDGQLTTRLVHSILSVDDMTERQEIRKYVKNELLARDSLALREYMKKVQPDINLTVELIDEETGDPFDINLPIDVNFFWPNS
tara:strand:+ start:375 stop:1250 length:876 start_codon:yes stop_codon:yes gene_type:complete